MVNKLLPYNWYPVPHFEGSYEINSLGTIRSIQRIIDTRSGSRIIKKHYLQTRVNNCGYREVRLSKNGTTKTSFLHVLLAQVFLPNPDKFPEVNHKNGIKLDNSIENLEWMTHSQNLLHAFENKLIKKKLKQLVDTCSGYVFESTKEAAKFYGLNYNTLRNYLSGNIKTNPTCLKYKCFA